MSLRQLYSETSIAGFAQRINEADELAVCSFRSKPHGRGGSYCNIWHDFPNLGSTDDKVIVEIIADDSEPA